MERRNVYSILATQAIMLLLVLLSRWLLPWLGFGQRLSLYLRLVLMAIFFIATILLFKELAEEQPWHTVDWFLLVCFVLSCGLIITIAPARAITPFGQVFFWGVLFGDIIAMLLLPSRRMKNREDVKTIIIQEPRRTSYMETEDDLKKLKGEEGKRVIIEELKEIDVKEEIEGEKEWEKIEERIEKKNKQNAKIIRRKNQTHKSRKQ